MAMEEYGFNEISPALDDLVMWGLISLPFLSYNLYMLKILKICLNLYVLKVCEDLVMWGLIGLPFLSGSRAVGFLLVPTNYLDNMWTIFGQSLYNMWTEFRQYVDDIWTNVWRIFDEFFSDFCRPGFPRAEQLAFSSALSPISQLSVDLVKKPFLQNFFKTSSKLFNVSVHTAQNSYF